MTQQLTSSFRQQLQTEIQEFICAHCPREGVEEILPGISVVRKESAGVRSHGMSMAAMAMTVQGEKQVVIGDRAVTYDPDHFLVTSLQMPVQSCVMSASPEAPYLAVLIELDPKFVASVILDANMATPEHKDAVSFIGVSPLTNDILETVARLTRLSTDEAMAEFLLPLTMKELVFRLLQTGQGDSLRQIAANSGSVGRVTMAIERLKSEYNRPLRVQDVARDVGMSVSGFHQHFKNVTGMSPLQFQKEVRLREARRLMLSENMDAASAGYEVGYDDPSHFSREYKKLFGNPPLRDIQRLRTSGELQVPA